MALVIESFNIQAAVNGLTNNPDTTLSDTTDRIAQNLIASFRFGTGPGEANMTWTGRRVIGPGADDDIILFGSLLDAYSKQIDFTAVKGVVALNRSLDPATILTIGNTGANWPPTPWQAPCGPSDPFVLVERQVGVAVTQTTADTFRVTNTDGANQATYDLVLIGTI